MSTTYPVIDIDTHFTEPRDLWTSRAPAKFKDTAPRVEEVDGHQRWRVGDDFVLGGPGFCVIKRDGQKVYGQISLETFEEMSEAASFCNARLAAMDELGLHSQILYPNILGFAGGTIMRIDDTELRNFCITGYNDAVGEMQQESRDRILPQTLLPFWDVELAVKELVRSKEQYNLRGFTMTDAPDQWGLPPLSDRYWDKLWATAQELDMPVNFHIGSGGIGGGPWGGMDPARSLATISTILFMNNMRCLINLIFSGLLDRFPRLKFVSVESGIGWIPFMLEACEYQMDENLIERGGLELRPREYFQRQIFASFWFEKENVARTLELLGEDNVMFETDFPHPTCLYPDVQGQIAKSLDGVSERVRSKVLYETAARVYNIAI